MEAAGRRSSYSTRTLYPSPSLFWNAYLLLSHRNVISGVAGLTADANSLVNYARQAAQGHLFNYNEDIPVELLVQRLCDLKQGYTQYGGTQPIHPFLYQAMGLRTCARSPAIRCFHPLRWLRPALQLPIVPLRPIRKLLWLEGDLYRCQLWDCPEFIEAGVQG